MKETLEKTGEVVERTNKAEALEGDVFNLPPEEKTDFKKTENKVETNIEEIISYFNKKGEEARKESTVKQNIFRTLKTAFLGASNIGNFFCNETKEQIKAWSNNPQINKFSKIDLERILNEAKAENYEGRLGTKQAENGKMEICYIPSKNAGWSVDKTKVME